MRQGIPAYYHPTTTVVVDDQVSFLNAIQSALGDDFPIRSTDTPTYAINLARKHGIDGSQDDNPLSIMANDERFNRLGIVVSDYRMPEMTGVQLVRQLSQSPIKKIILTGQMDSGSALALFNDRLIDRYIEKAHDDMMDELRSYLSELQQEIMESRCRVSAKNDSEFQALSADQAFCDWFNHYLEQNAFIEYYRVPEGFLVVDRDGAVSLLLIRTQAQLDALQEQARNSLQAPTAVVRKLEAREAMLHQSSAVTLLKSDEAAWESMLVSARQILGNQDLYFYALLEDTAPYPGRVNRSLEDYLRFLDEERFV